MVRAQAPAVPSSGEKGMQAGVDAHGVVGDMLIARQHRDHDASVVVSPNAEDAPNRDPHGMPDQNLCPSADAVATTRTDYLEISLLGKHDNISGHQKHDDAGCTDRND